MSTQAQSTSPRLLFAAGGTGGHIFPALAVADMCRQLMPDAHVEFVGTRGRLEEKVIPRAGYPINYLTISGLERKLSLKMLSLPAKLAISITQALRLIGKLRPHVVVCAGAYVSYPIGIAASLRNVPLVLMESNAYPGLVNRKLAPKATEVHVAFEETTRLMNCRRILVSGNPVRHVFRQTFDRAEARRHFGLDPEKPVVFAFGGSLGARSINAGLDGIMDTLRANGIQVIWQTGTTYGGDERKESDLYRSTFIHEMELGYAAADLVVARAGATTISELQAVGKPSVLIPLPIETVHQKENAEAMEHAGAALTVNDADVQRDLGPVIMKLISQPEELQKMGLAAHRLAILDADERIARRVIGLAVD